MAYEYTGEVVHLYDTETFPSGFCKRILVLTDRSEQYPQEVPFTFVKDKCELLNNLELGDTVTVSFDLRGREYNGKHFGDIAAWKYAVVEMANKQTESVTAPVPEPDTDDSGIDEEIPF